MGTSIDHVTVITPRFPLPLTSGTQLRVYHSLVQLAARFDVTLVSFVQDGEGSDCVEELEALGVEVRTVPHDRSKRSSAIRALLFRSPYRVAKFSTPPFRSAISEALESLETDLVWVHFLSTIPLLPDHVEAPVALDEHNADLRYWRSFAKGSVADRTFAWLNRRQIRHLQHRVAGQIDAVISVSEADAAVTRGWFDGPVVLAQNGVDIDRFSPTQLASEAGESVLFVGSLDVRMNEEAVVWFVESAWQDIHRERPDAQFAVVGKNPTKRVRRLDESPGVTVVGEVPDVVDHYDRAAVVVAPFQYGGGSKLKVLESLSMARPLVTTETGAMGFDIVDRDNALVRNRNGRFADAVVRLLENPSERDRLGCRGRSFVSERHTWKRIMDNAINDVFEMMRRSES